LFAGILGIIAGILVIQHPLWSTAVAARSLIIVLGLFGILMGAVSVYQAFKGAGWGTGILGAVSVVLGLVLLGNAWEVSFALPWVLGILAIIGGIAAIFGAFRQRGEEKALAAAAHVESEEPATRTEAVVEPDVEVPAAEELVAKEPAAEEVAAKASVVGAVAAKEAVVEEPAVEEPAVEEPAVEEPATRAEAVVAPVAEKAAAEESPDEEVYIYQSSLTYIEGIGKAYAEKLEKIGIKTPQQLLERGSTPKGRAEIIEQSGIRNDLVLTWINHADLFRVKGIGAQFAELLEAAGVDTVPALARRNAANLYKKLVEVNKQKHLVRHVPAQVKVEDWVVQAKDLPRMIHY
jgi:predicted flap endonuclease-1-like 5' DNA nuclease